MNKTSIEWTDLSSNPLKYRQKSDGKIVWACVKVSPGCRSCYAEATALRWNKGKLFNARNMEEVEPFMCEKELAAIMTKKTVDGVTVSGSRCFVGDMTDLFGEWVPDELLDKLFAVFALRPDVTFQVLTKRAEQMAAYMRWEGHCDASAKRNENCPCRQCCIVRAMAAMVSDSDFAAAIYVSKNWPLPNVWLGVSVENQEQADRRLPWLAKTPAAVRFVSFEPLLGEVVVKCPNSPLCVMRSDDDDKKNRIVWAYCNACDGRGYIARFDWAIIGGESGHGARPCNVKWVRSLVEQCKAAGVPAFVKQLGDKVPSDKVDHPAFFMKLAAKGKDMAEWPEDLRVREWPTRLRCNNDD
jgi:protein gp37